MVRSCPGCKAKRIPDNAANCHNCGEAYAGVTKTECPACQHERTPDNAKFCSGCGYDYKVQDPLVARMISMGASPELVKEVQGSAIWESWKQMNPLSQDLHNQMAGYIKLGGLGMSSNKWGF